jgi:radical SAM superfamily enzyme YgiQ (UPF0313 family)
MTQLNQRTKEDFNIVLISMFNQYAPQGLNFLHAVLKQAGFHCSLVLFGELDHNYSRETPLATEEDYQELVEKVVELKPNLVGISLASTFFGMSSQITKRIQSELKVPVVWGGIHPTLAPEDCIRVADMVCVGEGEHTLLELAERLYQGQDTSDIKGLWVRKGDCVHRNEVRPLIQELDTIPFPDLTVEDRYYLLNNTDTNPFFTVNYLIMSGRGCPFHCTYCCNSALRRIFHGKGDYMRRRSVENVIDELKEAKERLNIKFVYFFDDVFALDKTWIARFCERYVPEIGLPFMCYFHPTSTSEELLKPLLDAGLRYVEIGIQSGSSRIRREYFERSTPDKDIIKASKVFGKLKRKGLYVQYDLLVDNPFETEADKKVSLDILSQLSPPLKLSLFSLCYFPNTKLAERAIEQGVISEHDLDPHTEKSARQFSARFDLPRSEAESRWIATLYVLDFAKRRLPLIRNARIIRPLLEHVRHRTRVIVALYRTTDWLDSKQDSMATFLRRVTYRLHKIAEQMKDAVFSPEKTSGCSPVRER